MQGNAEKQVPVTYILQQFNQAKSVHKLPDEERAILSAGEIARMKETKHEQAREEPRKRREYMKMREEEARSPEPIVPTLAPDPPLPPVFDALQSTYLYRYNENQAGWIARPFLDSNGPDRSDGINGGQAERTGTLRLPSQYIGGAPSRVMLQARPTLTSPLFFPVPLYAESVNLYCMVLLVLCNFWSSFNLWEC